MTYKDYATANLIKMKDSEPNSQYMRDIAIYELWLMLCNGEQTKPEPIKIDTVGIEPETDFIKLVRNNPEALYIIEEYFNGLKIVNERAYYNFINKLSK